MYSDASPRIDGRVAHRLDRIEHAHAVVQHRNEGKSFRHSDCFRKGCYSSRQILMTAADHPYSSEPQQVQGQWWATERKMRREVSSTDTQSYHIVALSARERLQYWQSSINSMFLEHHLLEWWRAVFSSCKHCAMIVCSNTTTISLLRGRCFWVLLQDEAIIPISCNLCTLLAIKMNTTYVGHEDSWFSWNIRSSVPGFRSCK